MGADMENLANPERWLTVGTVVSDKIEAQVEDLAYQERSAYDGKGFDIRGTFSILWSRNKTRGTPGVVSWGCHLGALRGKPDSLSVDIFEGCYDQTEERAREIFLARSNRLY